MHACTHIATRCHSSSTPLRYIHNTTSPVHSQHHLSTFIINNNNITLFPLLHILRIVSIPTRMSYPAVSWKSSRPWPLIAWASRCLMVCMTNAWARTTNTVLPV